MLHHNPTYVTYFKIKTRKSTLHSTVLQAKNVAVVAELIFTVSRASSPRSNTVVQFQVAISQEAEANPPEK